jgi:hypothetical protein
MNPMYPRWARLLPTILLYGTHAAMAQPTCDSTNTVTFSQQAFGGYGVLFTMEADTSMDLLSTQWAVAGFDHYDLSTDPSPYFQFPGPGTYLACLQALVQLGQSGLCRSMQCALVEVPVDSLCMGLEPGFSITVGEGAIEFTDQTQGAFGDALLEWDFGDGTTGVGAAPVHVYTGYGPWQVCLTVTSGACQASVCNWVYMGPAEVPCDSLLVPAIGLIQIEGAIAAFDQSITSGMDSQVAWDFGDGQTTTGSPVVHIYPDEGAYELCSSVALWGPLAADTCAGSACTTVYIFGAAGVDEPAGLERLHVAPNPFTGSFGVRCPWAGPGVSWRLEDVLGRVLLQGAVPPTGRFEVEAEDLPRGPYLLRIISPEGAASARVLRV